MDGNGRWAKQRYLPRVAGHIRGVKRVKEIVEHCSEIGVAHLTLFAFGRENWRRPQEEVSFLMKLLSEQLNKEFYKLHEKNVKIRFIGDKTRLDSKITQQIEQLEQLTEKNTRIQ
ncbi:MAG: polyprenyl diphosphate synthase, partial [Burkholderiales bacterium]